MKLRSFLTVLLVTLLSLSTHARPWLQTPDRPNVEPLFNVGMSPPNFTLEDQYGRKITLLEEVKTQPVVLIFYRGYW